MRSTSAAPPLGAFTGVGYLLAFLLVVFPPVDTALNWGAFLPGAYTWRFGAIGSLAGVFLLPLTGLLLAFCLAHLAHHRIFQRILEWTCMLGFLATLGVLVLFAIDAVQVRSGVAQGMLRFDLTVVRAVLAQLFFALAILVMALASRRARGRADQALERAGARTGEQTPLIATGA